MELSVRDKELLLTVLESYTASQRLKTWNDEKAKNERLERVSDLASRIFYDLLGEI